MSTGIIIELFDEKGVWIGRAFQCKINPDDPMDPMYLDEFQDYVAKMERDEFLKRHDPNRIDGRHVRRELGDKLINLGLRVNRVKKRFI